MTVIPLRDAPALELNLPPGRWHQRLWLTDDPIGDAELYRCCVAQFDQSGLWPVLVPHDTRFARSDEDWVDDRGFNPPEPERADVADPADVLAGWWRGSCCEGRCGVPEEFPGLARKSRSRVDARATAANTGWMLGAAQACRDGHRLGLVRVARPADVPAALGWTGMVNYTQDVGGLSAVLRTWEDRFGAVLVQLGFDSLLLSVAAPPTTQSRALAVAAEHMAFCRDTFQLQEGDLNTFAARLVRTATWRFWWD